MLNESNAVIDHLLDERYLIDGGAEMLSIGDVAEVELGRRHFMELLAVFTAPPLFSVRHGRLEIGMVPDEVLFVRTPDGGPRVLLLSGRSWEVTHFDWPRRLIQVQPSDQRGIARWTGGGARLSAELARGVREVLAGENPAGVSISRRASDQLSGIRADRVWARRGSTTLVSGQSVQWWTFAGERANIWLAHELAPLRRSATAFDGLSITLDEGVNFDLLRQQLAEIDTSNMSISEWVSGEAVEQLKFAACLPASLALRTVSKRLEDIESVRTTLKEPVSTFGQANPV